MLSKVFWEEIFKKNFQKEKFVGSFDLMQVKFLKVVKMERFCKNKVL